MRLNTFRTTLQINLDAIESNVKRIKEKCNTKFMAIVKADAYGHGAVEISRHIQNECDFFGVACIDEALELRQGGIEKPILILGATPVSRFEDAIKNNVRISIFDYEGALEFSGKASALNINAPYHFAIDTGMNRIGFKPNDESAAICRDISLLPSIYPEGIFSHFACADFEDLSKTYIQKDKFFSFIHKLSALGVNIPLKHLNNSAGILDFDEHLDIVRSGIITYGLYPSEEVTRTISNLIPAMRWESYISFLKEIDKGEEISYGGTYTTTRKTKVATVPVGYADGYPRCLSGKFYVLINGKKAPILGKICMDQLMVDVTDIPDAIKGNKVTLFGRDGDSVITVEDIADAAGTFNYEFICGISRRVARIYYIGGKPQKSVNYLLDK
ncbi:MAG: alanine racemase [Ruminococcaceae bacterium]|nr:alanine racemase [Oscillospiraceae bacterium]